MGTFNRDENEMIKRLTDTKFGYEHPLFYNYPLALRCDLATAKTRRKILKRALMIFETLFGGGIDYVFCDHFIFDISMDWQNGDFVSESLGTGDNRLIKILYGLQSFPHTAVEDIAVDRELYPEELLKVNRCIAKTAGQKFDYKRYIKYNLSEGFPVINFVSIENDCIFTVYDDRGADIVFFSKEKYRRFFKLLQPYLLPYDLEEMKKRYD